MLGIILNYDSNEQKGYISSDNERYEFHIEDWKDKDNAPKNGDKIDFILENNIAKDIYFISNEYKKDKNLAQNKDISSMAIISLIFGIVGLMGSWWALGIPSIIAIITGHIAKSTILKNKDTMTGEGLATSGLVMGYIVLVIFILSVLALIGIST